MENDARTLGRLCEICHGIIGDHAPVPVCRSCGMKIARVFAPDLRLEEFAQRKRVAQRQAARRGDGGPAVVYYVQIGDYIKIGYTTRLRSRLRDLRIDAQSLLAIEPGSPDLERERHKQFTKDRISRRENFHPSTELMTHISRLKQEHALPRWASLPEPGRMTIRRA